MKILITGCAGFIGYHVAEKILNKFKSYQVFGVDNINSYYSKALKKKRVFDLKKNNKFKFLKMDISNKNYVDNFFKKHKFEIVIHMAAQAGVRYSFVNPESYIESNIKGFFNIIENSAKYKVKKFIFASSSSVYGEQKTYPFKENFELKPTNIYSFSKKLNEDFAKDLSTVTSMKIIGLRFFTIYGKFGRPDMFVFKFLRSSFKNLKFELNNNGNHNRDFTHIDDVTDIMNKLIKKKIKEGYQIFNVCSNNPSSLPLLISKIKKILNIDTNVVKIRRNMADVLMTHGDNGKIKKYLKIKKFRNIFNEIKDVIEWYKKNKIYKY